MAGKRKINDSKFAKLVEQGKSDKEIAKIFGVSHVAVWKRRKKLYPPALPLPMPKSFEVLTPMEKRFVMEKAKNANLSNTEIAMRTTESKSREVAKSVASEIMARPRVQVALNDLLDTYLPQEDRIKKLSEHVKARDPGISLKALDLSWKLDGSYAPEKRVDITMGYAELLKLRRGELAAIGEEIERMKSDLANMPGNDPEAEIIEGEEVREDLPSGNLEKD